jgi:hypothetical protein
MTRDIIFNETARFPFIKPWVPSQQVYVEKLKRWDGEDFQELSLRRDVAATEQLCELLKITWRRGSHEIQESFCGLQDLGYAGYCFLDFAQISYRHLLSNYADLSRRCMNDAQFKAVNIWNWREDLLDDSKIGQDLRARIIFKNPKEPIYRIAIDPEQETMFARLMPQDTELGHESGATQVQFVENVAEEFAAYHRGHKVLALDSRDILILASMDLVDRLSGNKEFEQLGSRIQAARAYRDVRVGRVFPGRQVGRIWFLYDTSVGIDYDVGYDDLRIGCAIGAEQS